MHRAFAIIASIVLLASCEQATPRPSASPSLAACAPAITPGPPLNAHLATVDVPIGSAAVFGLDGAFVGSAFGYPLGAGRHWSLRDETGRVNGALEWGVASFPLASPDGSRVAYMAGASPGVYGLTIRDVAGGTGRLVATGDRRPYAWLDDQHVLIDPDTDHGAVHSVDVRDGSDTVVFRPLPPPSPNALGDDHDGWQVSGDLRWAILTRYDAQ